MEKKRKLVVLIPGLQDWKKFQFLPGWPRLFGLWAKCGVWDLGAPFQLISFPGSVQKYQAPPIHAFSLCFPLFFPLCVALFPASFFLNSTFWRWFRGKALLPFGFIFWRRHDSSNCLFVAESETFFFLLLPFWDEVGFFLVLTPHFGGITGWVLGGVTKPRVMRRAQNLHFGASTPDGNILLLQQPKVRSLCCLSPLPSIKFWAPGVVQ